MNPIPFDDFGGEGSVLHFAHANAYPPGVYRQFLTPLTADFRVLAAHHRPLWPGSRPDDVPDWRVVADDLLRFLDDQQLGNVIGVGHSLGAVATMFAALQRPSAFRALVLIEPVFLPPPLLQLAAAHPAKTKLQPLVTRALQRRHTWPDRDAAFDHFRARSVFARWSDDALRDFVAAGLHPTADGVALTYAREWEAHFYGLPPLTVWEDLAHLEHPTLALRAEHSDVFTPETWQLWQQTQPHATFINMPDVGHLLPMEKPVEVAEIIGNWVIE